MFKRTLKTTGALLIAAAMLAGCKGTPDSADQQLVDQIADEFGVPEETAEAPKAEWSADEIHNFIMPEQGEKIAVITVKDYGEIKIKLFPEDAAKGVENFIGLAEMGYYDELIFHRVIPSFMIQGGDPKGNGTGGKSIWGDKFEGGTSDHLYHFSGAVAYANSGATSTNGSQFYIVNTDDGEYSLGGYRRDDGSIYYYKTFEEAGYTQPESGQALYREKGGTPSLDGGYTVFGQVFEGMDVVRAIAQVETNQDESNGIPVDKPLTPVIIESIRIVEFEG